MSPRGGRVGLLAGLLAGLLVLLLVAPASAHESRPAYLELRELDARRWSVVWKVPGLDADRRLALDLRWPGDCELVAGPTRVYAARAFVERSELERAGGLVGTTVSVDGLAGTATDVLVRIERRDGQVEHARISPDSPQLTIPATPGPAEIAGTYLRLGVEHILTGVDHLLFIVCLVLITGPGRRLLVTVTGFTLAHSLTLALVTLGLVTLPTAPVEAVIALSVVFLAHEIVVGDPDAISVRYPAGVSTTFGLLHGFGFAAVLGEVGLPASEVPLSLLCFNVGVELGQLVFVAGLLVLGWAAAGSGASARSRSLGARRIAQACGVIAGFWVVERVVGFWAG